MVLGIYRKTGLKISRADIPLHQKTYGLFGMGSEKILDFISSVSVKLDMIQHNKHTVQRAHSKRFLLFLLSRSYWDFLSLSGYSWKDAKVVKDADSLPGDV